MTTDDNQKLRQLLDMTAALISSMDVARRGHTETDRTAWFSYKVFATRYMAIIHQLPQDFPALVVLNPYNTSDMPEPSRSRPSYQRPIFEGVYTDLWILRASLESIIGTAGDERRALTDFFQSRLRAAMMERPEDEKAVQDTVEALLVGRGLQKSEVGWEKWTPKSDKLERRRCQDEEGPARKVYQGIPAGSSEAGIGGESVIARGRASVVLTAIDVGVLGEAV